MLTSGGDNRRNGRPVTVRWRVPAWRAGRERIARADTGRPLSPARRLSRRCSPGQHVDVRARRPGGVRLAAVGIAERPGARQAPSRPGAGCRSSRAAPRLVPNASSPTRSLLASVWQYSRSRARDRRGAARRDQSAAADLEHQRGAIEDAVFAVEVVAGGPVAHEHAVHRTRRGEGFAGRQVRPVARVDEAAGLDPGQRPGRTCAVKSVPAAVRTVSIRAVRIRSHSCWLRQSTWPIVGPHAFAHDPAA